MVWSCWQIRTVSRRLPTMAVKRSSCSGSNRTGSLSSLTPTIMLPSACQRREPDLGARARGLEMQDRNRRQSVVAGRHVPSGGLARLPWAETGGLALPHHPETGTQRQRLDVRTLCFLRELIDLLVDQPGMECGAARRGQVDQAFEKRLVGGDAKDRGLVERAGQPVERLVTGFGPGDQLREH